MAEAGRPKVDGDPEPGPPWPWSLYFGFGAAGMLLVTLAFAWAGHRWAAAYALVVSAFEALVLAAGRRYGRTSFRNVLRLLRWDDP
jgi:hypothetical protein